MKKICKPSTPVARHGANGSIHGHPPYPLRLLHPPRLPRLLCGLLLSAACAPAALANDTAELRVVGRVVPAPCTIDLANNGNADFGVITAAELATDGRRKVTGERKVPFTISCSPANSPKLSFKDERPDSVPEVYARLSTAVGLTRMFGLGKVADKNIGAYVLHLTGVKADGEAARMVRSADGEAPWELLEPEELIRKDYKYVWSTTPQAQSGRFGAINGEIVIRVMPEPIYELPLQSEIKLDGSTSLALEYL